MCVDSWCTVNPSWGSGRHFRKFKAQTSNVSSATFLWKETFEFWVLNWEFSLFWERENLFTYRIINQMFFSELNSRPFSKTPQVASNLKKIFCTLVMLTGVLTGISRTSTVEIVFLSRLKNVFGKTKYWCTFNQNYSPFKLFRFSNEYCFHILLKYETTPMKFPYKEQFWNI